MGAIRWTDEAIRWLVEIHDHNAQDNASAAQRVVDGFPKKAEILDPFPEAGQRLDHPSGRNLRILLYGHYRIAYLVKDDGGIDIIGVYHGALDLARHLPDL